VQRYSIKLTVPAHLTKGFALDIPHLSRPQGEMAIDYPAGFGSGGAAMNAFYKHHKDSIRFRLSVF
jgi:hypothetical protein